MDINERIKEADDEIERVYNEEIVNQYHPLFAEVRKKADAHMKAEGITSIKLSPKCLEYHSPGEFWEDGCVIQIGRLPKICQDESDYIAGQADSRSHITPSYHQAMRSAFNDFREKVRKSLASVI